MAQRRVNLPFVGAILAAIVILGCVALGLKFLVRKDPAKLAKQAEDVRKTIPGDQGLRKAIEYVAKAKAIAPQNTEYRLQLARYLNELGQTDDDAKLQAFKEYGDILGIDPTNKDALQPLLHRDVEMVQFVGRPQDFTALRERAEQCLKVSENDPRYADPQKHKDLLAFRREAEAYEHIAVVAAWLRNIVTPESTLAEHIKALDEMLKADVIANDPERFDPDIPYYLCQAYWKQSNEARALGTDESKALAVAKEKQAYQTFDDVLRKVPDDVSMNVRFYQVLRTISAGVDDDDGTRSDRPDYVKRMYDLLSHAHDVAHAREVALIAGNNQPENPSTSDAYLSYADFLSRDRDKLVTDKKIPATTPTATDVLKEYYGLRPDNQDARYFYGRALGGNSATRPQAIKMLQQEIVDRGDKSALRHRDRRKLEIDTYSLLIELLVESSHDAKDAAARAELVSQAQDAFKKLADRDRQGGYLTALYSGEIALQTKSGTEGAIQAIPDLERARQLHDQIYGANKSLDLRLEQMLCDAYLRSNQTGLAMEQLKRVIQYWPDYAPGRKAIARLMVTQNQPDMASNQIREIKRIEREGAKDDKELQQLETAVMMLSPKTVKSTDVDKALATMPELTPQEVSSKIQVCLIEGRYDDAIRLHEKMRQDAAPWPGPADVNTVRSLVQLYMNQGKKDQAIKVSDEALAKKKDDISLQIVRAQIDKDAEKVKALTLKGIESVSDPVTRELMYYDWFRGHNEKDDANKHLDAAQKLDPENPRILDLRFQQYVLEGKFAQAEAMLPKLSEKNYDEAHGLIYRYRLAMLRGDLPTAQDVVQQMIETLPQYARTWVYAGDVLQRQGKYVDAIAKYNEALSRQSGNGDALHGMIACSLGMQPPRSDDAWTYIQKGRQLYPSDQWFKEQEIGWELSFAPEKAIAPREAEAKANPDQMGAQVALYAAYWELAKNRLQKNRPEEAKEPLRKAHDGFAQVIAKWPAEGEIEYAYFGDICNQTGDFTGGETALKAFAASDKWKDSPKPDLLLGGYYDRAGKFDQAEAAFKDALARSKNAPEVRYRVSRFYRDHGKYEQAIAALDASSPDPHIQEQLVHLYIDAGKLTLADQLMAKLLAAAPKDTGLLVTEGMLQMQEQKFPDALATTAKALEVDPHNSAAYYCRGLVHMRMGAAHLPEAVKELTNARDNADPANLLMQVQSRMMLGEALRANGQQDEGATELASAVQMDPSNKNLRMRLIEMLGTLLTPRWGDVEMYIHQAQQMPEFKSDPDWYRVEATMWAQRKQDAKALETIRHALDLAKGQPNLVLALMQDYVSILTRLEQYPKLEAETSDLLKNADAAKDGWWVYQAHGIAIARQGRKVEALGDFDNALAITTRVHNDEGTMKIVQSVADSIGVDQAINRLENLTKNGDNRWRSIIVELYLRKGDTAKAEARADLVAADADNGNLKGEDKRAAYTVAGMTYMAVGHYDKAMKAYDNVLKLSPDDTVALNNLAYIYNDYLTPPNSAKALEYSSRAVQIVQKAGVSAPDLLDTHGWVLVSSGKVDDGINFLQQSLEIRPLLDAYYHLGVALLKKNLAPEALVQLTKAQKMVDDRKHKGQAVDAKLEAGLTDALARAKAMVNASSAGTQEAIKP